MKIEKYIEDIKNGKLATPAYLFNCTEIDEHIKSIKKIVGENINLCYAMKANPLLVKYVNELVDTIEVCSPGELEICKRCNIPPQSIVFSGVNKKYEDIESAFKYGVGIITIESYKHFMLIKDYCVTNNCEANVYLRLSDGAQFGLDEPVLEKIVKAREQYKYIHIKGIHYFSGTQKKNTELNIDELKKLIVYIDRLRDTYGLDIECLEYGLGLHVQYFTNEDFNKRYEGLKEIMNYLDEREFPYKIAFEMGRYFVAGSGTYLTTVDDIKTLVDKNYCIVDGGIHHLNYYGQNMAMRTPVIQKIDFDTLGKKSLSEFLVIDNLNNKWTICGSLCTYADVLARNVFFESIKIGDILAFENAGAYSITESPNLFLSRSMPNVYLYSEDHGITKVRDGIDTVQLNSIC